MTLNEVLQDLSIETREFQNQKSADELFKVAYNKEYKRWLSSDISKKVVEDINKYADSVLVQASHYSSECNATQCMNKMTEYKTIKKVLEIICQNQQ